MTSILRSGDASAIHSPAPICCATASVVARQSPESRTVRIPRSRSAEQSAGASGADEVAEGESAADHAVPPEDVRPVHDLAGEGFREGTIPDEVARSVHHAADSHPGVEHDVRGRRERRARNLRGQRARDRVIRVRFDGGQFGHPAAVAANVRAR